MKMFVLALIAVVGFQAKADVPAHRVSTHKEFVIRSSTIDGWVYYNCDSVEDTVTDLLTKLGAGNISVRCTGGIQDDQPLMDAFVDVTFDALKVAGASDTDTVMAKWTPVKIDSWDNCDLKSQILKETQSGFSMMDVKVSSCWDSSSPFRASLTTLF